MKKIILILLILIAISIPFVFWYISIWANDNALFSDKMFITGLFSTFHVFLSGIIVAIYIYSDESGKNLRKS